MRAGNLSDNTLRPRAFRPSIPVIATTNHVTQPTAPPMMRAFYAAVGTTETNDDSTDDGDTATTKYYYALR